MSFFVAYSPVYVHPVPENHRFPMEKYSLLKDQLLYEGIIMQAELFDPQVIDAEFVLRVHSSDYYEKLIQLSCSLREQRVSGFVHSKELIERELIIMEGTRKCAELVVDGGIAFNIAGGTHHAFSDRGEGFCLLNDQAIASVWLLENTAVKRILIIDLDVHQGNGTAEIFQDNPAVFTFSMHGQSNYPLQKEQSDLDVGLQDYCDDETYLQLLSDKLVDMQHQFQPDFIFYQCGVDVLASDKLGKLGLTLAGCAKRDALVFAFANQLTVPIVCTMGGGYSPEIRSIIEAHTNTFRQAQKYF
ncbi:MAG: histone deacetylase [Fluviicola sp.]|nr:histone deacetylase [Fluviicola sp.]MBP6272627.1 histone deacetylase [Fluviicola sp.]